MSQFELFLRIKEWMEKRAGYPPQASRGRPVMIILAIVTLSSAGVFAVVQHQLKTRRNREIEHREVVRRLCSLCD